VCHCSHQQPLIAFLWQQLGHRFTGAMTGLISWVKTGALPVTYWTTSPQLLSRTSPRNPLPKMTLCRTFGL
jgi:hypothetical protein